MGYTFLKCAAAAVAGVGIAVVTGGGVIVAGLLVSEAAMMGAVGGAMAVTVPLAAGGLGIAATVGMVDSILFKENSRTYFRELYKDIFGLSPTGPEFDILYDTSIVAFKKYINTYNYKTVKGNATIEASQMYKKMMTVYMFRTRQFLPLVFLKTPTNINKWKSYRAVGKLSLLWIEQTCKKVGFVPTQNEKKKFQNFAYKLKFDQKDAEKFIRAMWKYEKHPSMMFQNIDAFFEKLTNASTINSDIMKTINNIMKRYHDASNRLNKKKKVVVKEIGNYRTIRPDGSVVNKIVQLNINNDKRRLIGKKGRRITPKRLTILTPNQVKNRMSRIPRNDLWYYTVNNRGELKNMYTARQLTENERRRLPSGARNNIFKTFGM